MFAIRITIWLRHGLVRSPRFMRMYTPSRIPSSAISHALTALDRCSSAISTHGLSRSSPFQTTPFLVSILCLKQPVSFIPYSSLRSNLFAFPWFVQCAVSLLFTEGLTLFSTNPPVSNCTIPCFDSLFEGTCLLHSLLISPIQSLCIRLVSSRRHCCCGL